jgi:hypothetical protein
MRRMPKKCPAGKIECLLLDMGSDGTMWCDTNTDIYQFEQCPWPKRREKRIKAEEKLGPDE